MIAQRLTSNNPTKSAISSSNQWGYFRFLMYYSFFSVVIFAVVDFMVGGGAS